MNRFPSGMTVHCSQTTATYASGNEWCAIFCSIRSVPASAAKKEQVLPWRMTPLLFLRPLFFIRPKQSIASGESWKYSTGQKTVSTHSAITPPKVNRSGWNLEHCKHIIGDYPWQILDNLRCSRNFLVREITHDFTDFPPGKFYDIWTQLHRSARRWKRSEQNFENFTIRGVFQKHAKKLLTKFQGFATSG